jgi:outer membrane protein TolC
MLTPVPLTDAERSAEAADDLVAMFADQQPLTRRLTLEEAFARALAYNLDHRVKLMEEAIANNDLDISRYELLPRVVANASRTWRSNVEASSSVSILTGKQSLEPSTSTDRTRRLADLTLSWNILDFGVSYFTARQQANRALIAEEQRRKVLQNLFQEVRRAFWRAASAQRLRQEVSATIGEAQGALSLARQAESEALRSPIDSLRYQKALLDLLRQLEGIERQLSLSKTELASLINLPPGRNFAIAVPGERTMRIRRVGLPVRQMEHLALLRNPDLLEASYQGRINADETRKTFLRLLPGINLTYGPQYDSNSFLVNNNWVGSAVRLSGNLIGLLQLPAQHQRAKNVEQVTELRRQALSIAVLAKVHVAYQQYLSAMKEYEWAEQLSQVDRRLYQQIVNRTTTDAQGELERVSARVSAVSSDLRRYQSYAEAQAALGRLYATLGIDPVPSEAIDSLDIGSLSRAIRHSLKDWESGRIAERHARASTASGPARVAESAQQQQQPQAPAAEKSFGFLSVLTRSAATAETLSAQSSTSSE